MKKVLILVVAVAAMTAPVSGQAFRYDKKAILDKIARSDADIANEKRAARAQTWLDRGDAMFMAEGGMMLTQTFPGQAREDMILRLGKAEFAAKEVNGKAYQVYSYPYADIYLAEVMAEDGPREVVQFWEVKDIALEGANDKALEAYKKAAELDIKLLSKAQRGIEGVGDVYSLRGNAQLSFGNRAESAENYWKGYRVKNDPMLGKVDSVLVFNAGYLYLMEGDYPKAIEILEEAERVGVVEGGKTPYYLAYAYRETEQLDRMKETIEKGMAMFPDNKDLIESLISYYALTKGDFGEIRGLLEKTLAENPSNMAIWDGLGQVYFDEGNADRSIEYFGRYAAQFPDDTRPNYYLGDAWMEKGNKILDDAQNDKTLSKAAREEADARAKEAYRQAWKYLYKSYEGDPTEEAVVQRLVYMSYRLIDEPGMQANYDRFEAENNAIRAARGE